MLIADDEELVLGLTLLGDRPSCSYRSDFIAATRTYYRVITLVKNCKWASARRKEVTTS